MIALRAYFYQTYLHNMLYHRPLFRYFLNLSLELNSAHDSIWVVLEDFLVIKDMQMDDDVHEFYFFGAYNYS